MDAARIVISAVDQASAVINNIKQNVQQMADSSKKAIGSFTDSINKNKEWLESLRNASAVAFAAVAGAIWLGVRNYSSYQQWLKDVQIATQSNTDEMKKHIKIVERLALQYWELPTSILKGSEEIWKMGLTIEQLNSGALEQALLFQNAVWWAFEWAAQTLGTVLDQYKKNVSELPGIVNQATWVINQTKMSLEDYRWALAQWWWAAAGMGVELEEFNNTLALTASYFSSGSDAGTSFKTFLNTLTPASKQAGDLMKQLGLNFYDARGQMLPMRDIAEQLQTQLWGLSEEQRNFALKTIFGSDAMRTAIWLMQAWWEGYEDMAKKLWKTNAIDQANDRMNTLNGFMKTLSAGFAILGNTIGETFAPVVQSAVQYLIPLVQSINEWIQQNPMLAQTLGTIALAVTGLIAVATWLALLIPSIAAGVGVLSAAFGVLWVAITWPIWIVIASVAALYLAYTTNFLGIKTIVDTVINRFVATVPLARQTIVTAVQTQLMILSSVFTAIWQGIQIVFEAVRSTISATLTAVLQVISATALAFYQLFTWDRQWFWDTVTSSFMMIWDSIILYFQNIWLLIQASWMAFAELFQIWFLSFWTGIKTSFTATREAMKKSFLSVMDFLALFFTGEWRAKIATGFTAMLSDVAGITKWVVNGVISGFEWMVNGAIALVNQLIDAINQVNVASWLTWSIGRLSNVTFPRFAQWGLVDAWVMRDYAKQFAGWGMVTGPSGIDRVPAMLTAWELVLNRSQQQNLAWQLGSGGGQTVYITFQPQIYGSKDGLAEELMDSFMRQFKQHTTFESF